MQDQEQFKYFLGEEFESLQSGATKSGAQLTPSRKHIVKHADEFLRYDSKTFSPVESLAYGGLGAAWGLGCCVYSEKELNQCSLDPGEMNEAYEVVAERIGISADATDNAAKFTIGKVSHHLPPLQIDECEYLLRNFSARQSKFNEQGFFMGRPALALLSKDYKDRKATQYDDMHFYRDAGNSAYRPAITIDELKRQSNFRYEQNQLVITFTENEGTVEVKTLDTQTKEQRNFRCRKLVLATGALSTARIVLRSLNYNKEIPFLCNPYTYYPCLNWKLAGKKLMQYKTGMAQLSLFHDSGLNEKNIAMASIYSYRSLFLFRLLNEVPLNFKDAKEIMRFLLSGIVIMGIHHPDEFSSNRFMKRKADPSSLTGDNFEMEYRLSVNDEQKLISREKAFISVMKKLGARALKRVAPAMGASIHYAGTLPFSKEKKDLCLATDGRVWGTEQVYVADSSGFTYLPAKGLTFSLMANAHNVANKLTQGKK